MNGIELLMQEHQNILKFTDYVKKLCCDVLENGTLNTTKFRECIDFGRNYADKYHHGKEEKILFRIMLENLDVIAEKLISNGMLVEHDLGRFHVGELEESLNHYDENPTVEAKLAIITNASGYADLLRRHIEKEDTAVFSFAERSLSDELKIQVDQETKLFEEESTENGIQEKYLKLIDEWFDEK